MSEYTETQSTRSPLVTWSSRVTPRPVRWLLHHRIPLASVTLLAGREGLGKSTMWAHWSAQLTHGRLPGDLDGTPSNVLIIANEDSLEHTLVPRLIAAGADLDRVGFLRVNIDDFMSESVNLPRDFSIVSEAVASNHARLLVIDPLVSVLDGRLDSHKDHSIRQALDPLNHLADSTGLAILGLVHLNKGQGSDVLDRVLGSRAFTAAARSVLAMTLDDQDDSGKRLLVFQSKSNLGPRSSDGYVVEIETVTIDTSEGPAEVGKATIIGSREIDQDEAMRQGNPDDLDEISDAGRWLLSYLADNGGEAASQDVMTAGRTAGHSKDQLKRAAKRLRVPMVRSGFPSSTTWHYPTQLAQSEHPAQSADRHGDRAPTGSPHSEHFDFVSSPTAPTALAAPTGSLS